MCNATEVYGHDLVDCTVDQQKQILDRIAYPAKAAPEDSQAVAFFNHLRDLVVGSFYSSKIGVKDIAYVGNRMVPEWNGCPEPSSRNWASVTQVEGAADIAIRCRTWAE